MIKIILFFGIIFATQVVIGQDFSKFSSTSEIGTFVSSSYHLPFWLRANQWGQVPLTPSIGTARLGMRYHSQQFVAADSSDQKARLNWEFGIEGVANTGYTSNLLLPEAHAKLHWKQLEIMVGRERQIVGIVDTTLSSGSYSWSGNALPVPMIQFKLADYLPFGFLKNFISIKGSFAHGWLLNTYIQKSYLHQKSLYGRFGKPEGNIHLQLGLAHHVMWGGEADYLVNNPVAVNGKLTSTFRNYLFGVVLAQIPREKSNNQITTFDGINRIGNHVGHFDFAVDWKIRKMQFLLYRQHPFEDASGLEFQNLPDGLYGLSLQRNPISNSFFTLRKLTLEYLYTKDQSGDFFTIPGSRFSGEDGYFNHGQYMEGWSYKQHGLGTPFIPTKLEVGARVSQNGLYFPTNRITLYHVGIKGMLAQKVQFIIKISYSQHYPTSTTPISNPTYRQFSSLLMLNAPLLHWGDTHLKAQIAYDRGQVLPMSLGGYLGIKSYFYTKKK